MKPKTDFGAIDHILASDDELIPSSGFLSAVMDRVYQEAAAPPPIPFPWKLALPGFVLLAAVAGWGVYEAVRFLWLEPQGFALSQLKVPAAVFHDLQQAGWVVAALLVAAVSWMFPRRMVRGAGLL
ncbi:MAG TPA: hypothetical protein VGG26_01935 [Terracidiphilus sp.]|jgi:hypothetical protein